MISYVDLTAGDLKVARCANAACTGAAGIVQVDSANTASGRGSSRAIGADGAPAISYQSATSHAMKVAKCVYPSCR